MAVPFDWMEPKRNPDAIKAQRGRREQMYRTELEERAALLARLGHARDSVRTRLAANLAWDFERGGNPVAPGQLDAILDRVFGTTPAGKPGPRAKGGAR